MGKEYASCGVINGLQLLLTNGNAINSCRVYNFLGAKMATVVIYCGYTTLNDYNHNFNWSTYKQFSTLCLGCNTIF
jgi:hypothetical protein